MEELKRQLGDSLPGTMAVFAEAWAEKSQSGLTGQQAINDLYAAVEKGQLVSADILPIVSEIMSRKAQPKLGIMKRSSIAEQARAINAMNELAETFSKGGGEQGFATMFRDMHRWMPRLKPLVEGLGEGFKKFGEHVGTAFRIFTHNAGYLWDFKKTLDSVKLSMGGFELSLGNIAIAATAMLLPIGRLAAALGLIYLALDEINVAVEGGDAFLTPVFDWAENKYGADRGILGITTGLVALMGSVLAIRKVKSWFAPLAEAGTAAGAAGGAANTAKTLGHTANAAKSGWGFLRLGNIFETLKAGAKGGLGFEFALNLMTNSVEDYENKWGFKRSDKIFGGYLINDLLIRITGSMAELGDTIIDIADFFAGGRIREFLDTSFNDGIWEISEWFKDKLSVLNQDWQFVKGWFGDISWVKNRDDTSWGMDAAGYGNLTKKVEAIPKDSGFRFFAPHTHNSNDPINKWQWERGINNGSSFDRALDSLSSPFSTNSNSTNNNDVNIEIKIDGSSNPQAVAIEVEKTLANIFANTNNSFGMA